MKINRQLCPHFPRIRQHLCQHRIFQLVQECSHSKIPGNNFRSVFKIASLESCPLVLHHVRRQWCFRGTDPCWATGSCTACTRAGTSPALGSPALRYSWASYQCWTPSSHCSVSHSALKSYLNPSLYIAIQVLQHAGCKTWLN